VPPHVIFNSVSPIKARGQLYRSPPITPTNHASITTHTLTPTYTDLLKEQQPNEEHV